MDLSKIERYLFGENAKTRYTEFMYLDLDETDSQSPYLALIYVEQQNNEQDEDVDVGKRYKLNENEQLIIGHSLSAQVQLPKELVAEKQAMFFYQRGHWYIKNLSDKQNTFNEFDMLTSLHPLKRDGELFRVGPIIFKFFNGKGPESFFDRKNFSRSRIDSLTKVYNHKYLFEKIEDELSWFYRPDSRQLSLLMLDVDHFKKVNDTYGHLGGNRVLKTICERIQKRLRKHEKLGRFGGEEFVVIMPGAGKEKAKKLAEEIRILIAEEPVLYEDQQIPVTVSIGISSVEKKAGEDCTPTDRATLLDQADKKLYEAKAGGRNQVRD